MNKKLMIITSIAAVIMVLLTLFVVIYFGLTQGRIKDSEDGYYLLCYFTGNDPDQERVCFAISEDGYRYDALNAGHPMIAQTIGTGCCRDPYVFRANGKYYVIATDMKSNDGWNSNHAMVIFESDNLITWQNERIIDIKSKEGYEATCRTWAPQVIYDTSCNKYMVYWSHCLNTDWKTYMVYAYLNDDFTDIDEINTLYQTPSGKDAIDGDIIFENDTYYLYFKDEKESKICYATSKTLTGPYVEPEKSKISLSRQEVEGSCMYRLAGTGTYLMIMDQFHKDGKYYMQSTTVDSMTKFKKVRASSFKFPQGIRHASVMSIDKDEYFELKKWSE